MMDYVIKTSTLNPVYRGVLFLVAKSGEVQLEIPFRGSKVSILCSNYISMKNTSHARYIGGKGNLMLEIIAVVQWLEWLSRM